MRRLALRVEHCVERIVERRIVVIVVVVINTADHARPGIESFGTLCLDTGTLWSLLSHLGRGSSSRRCLVRCAARLLPPLPIMARGHKLGGGFLRILGREVVEVRSVGGAEAAEHWQPKLESLVVVDELRRGECATQRQLRKGQGVTGRAEEGRLERRVRMPK